MTADLFITKQTQNPLDTLEEVLADNGWSFTRTEHDELVVDLAGKSCDYRLFFIWEEAMSALHFCARYDICLQNVAQDKEKEIATTLMRLNEALWIGHFDIPERNYKPNFRHTHLFDSPPKGKLLKTIIDAALSQCERHYTIFSLLSQPQTPVQGGTQTPQNDAASLSLALMETHGKC